MKTELDSTLQSHPLVSILIPTYNRAHLLGETLDSVLAQTYTHWECIVVDDGSTDDTALVVSSYLARDSRFFYYQRPETFKPGGNGARNFGFQLSKGAYIHWFDSDDLMAPQKLELTLNGLLLFSADVFVCKPTSDSHSFATTLTNLREEFSTDFYRTYLLNRLSILTGDVVFKREVVAPFTFDEALRKAQEFEFFTRVFAQPLRIVFTNSGLWYHRETMDSISRLSGNLNEHQLNSLVYLSSQLQKRYASDSELLHEVKRYGRKLYISLVQAKKVRFVFTHYGFFARCFSVSYPAFFFWIFYNLLTQKGFDALRKKSSQSL